MIGFAFLFRSYRSINTVVLGGTHQENDYNTNVNDDDTHFIYDGCIKLIPSIKRAEIAFSKVGLRPGRNRVRLERNIFTTSKHMTHMVKMLLLQFAAIKLFVILMAYISCSLFCSRFLSLSFLLYVFSEHGKKLDIISNYGHGGSGITLAYGCAIEVADLVESVMKLKSKL